MIDKTYPKGHKKRGYVTLLSVIILGAISILVLTTTMVIDTESIYATDVLDQGKQAKAYADSCAERAIDLLKQNTAYVGGETYTLTGGTCTVNTLTGTGNSNRTFTTLGVFENSTRRVSVSVTTVNPTTVIGSWQEIQ
ncbi:MAG: hypothetical protein ACMG57_00660 [Candidatus Dojkabacteria bacterium]